MILTIIVWQIYLISNLLNLNLPFILLFSIFFSIDFVKLNFIGINSYKNGVMFSI